MEQPRGSDDTTGAAPAAASTVLFREIHKNAWLKRLLVSDKKSTGAVPKKGERVWVVFCVHDDAEPYLEVYLDQKVAVMHKPDWCVPLSNCLHVSPTICAQEDEYEFVVTLTTEVVRFTAPSWELMMEWVDTIRSKLREMRILSPKENLYTRMPEARLPLAPTRDPNSPLPAPPAGPSMSVPGVEPVHSESSDGSSSSGSDENVPPVSLQIRTTSTSLYITQSEPPVYTRPHQTLSRAASVPESPVFLASHDQSQDENVTVIQVSSSQQTPLDYQSVFNFNFIQDSLPLSHENLDFREDAASNETFYTPPATPATVEVVDAGSSYYECVFLPSMAAQSPRSLDSSSDPSAVRSLSASTPSVSESSVRRVESSSRPPNDVLTGRTGSSDREQYVSPGRIQSSTRNPMSAESSSRSNDVTTGRTVSSESSARSSDMIASRAVSSTRHPMSAESSTRNNDVVTNRTVSSESSARSNELIASRAVSSTRHPVSESSSRGSDVAASRTVSSESSARSNELIANRAPASVRAQQTPADSSSRSADVVASRAVSSEREGHQGRRRSSSNSESTLSPSGPSHVTRRVATPRVEMERRLQPAPHPYRQAQQVLPGGSVEVVGSGRLTLREQQVLQLRREMLHPGGVRLQLRRKDCTGSIALVDAFGAVWITGWKQREHPMLYNALHIGDQLLSVAGIVIQSAADAQKLIRGAVSLYVEFVIRRVPFGRVFAIRREVEGQSLGITQEGNTAEIRDVVPGGLAACHGLSPRAQTCDGLSLTNWVITEINGRPLNLFFKDGEVRDRLNAVGKEISILVQPFDLIKQLKKQLKALRSYKEYIVQ